MGTQINSSQKLKEQEGSINFFRFFDTHVKNVRNGNVKR